MNEENTITEDSLILLGEGYKRATAMKVVCYKLAQLMAQRDLPIYKEGIDVVDQLDHMKDLQIGVMLCLDWGISVPGELMKKANITVKLPSNLEIH